MRPFYAFASDTENGLTAREYFAGLALQGMLASGRYDTIKLPCTRAAECADALLATLEKPSAAVTDLARLLAVAKEAIVAGHSEDEDVILTGLDRLAAVVQEIEGDAL